ncbi:MAG: UDP-N-acetylmuramoyl-L-alanyl-D-glutamate--2,6-diaminopimelate ligase [Candidatus Heteroscillospira sp.]|jgi:UDP-N-acetylmuramoyl-L-alanyl-D-glutamate--2,6-diaminopimelate ligase
MKLKELLEGVQVLENSADLEMEVGCIRYDSRAVEPGDVFVAIVGFETDGHKYIASAMERGAAAVVCQLRMDDGVPFVRVANSRLALALMSRTYFGNPAGGMTMIGVTGTNGKTTTTLLLKHVLEEVCGAKVGLIGTNSNMIGDRELPTERTTPESYELHKLFREMADEGCTHVVMEVSSHSLALDRVAGIRFAVGLFTNLTQDHLDFHGTMENYAQAKALLFSQCDMGAVNLDDEWAPYMLERAECPVLRYSVDSMEGDLIANDLRISPSGVKFVALHGTDGLARVNLPIPGRFSVYNALGVLACCLCLNLDLAGCAQALRSAHGVKGRVEVVPTDGDYHILIDYAHTPDALENVLRSMRDIAEGRVVLLFGCGGDRDRTKRPVMGAIAAKYADFVIVTSDNPRTEEPKAILDDILAGMKGIRTPYVVIENRREAIAYAIDNHLSNDIIILAGKGHETYQIIGKTKHHMDEREIVAEHLALRAAKKEK